MIFLLEKKNNIPFELLFYILVLGLINYNTLRSTSLHISAKFICSGTRIVQGSIYIDLDCWIAEINLI